MARLYCGAMAELQAQQVGIGWRPELAADLLRQPHALDFIEVVAESCFVSTQAWREAVALRELWPVVPHGVKLSLGSAEGIEREHARRLGRLARELRAPVVSEHVAFVRSGGVEVGHLTPVPRSREAVRVIARNVAQARRFLPDVPLLLENIACTLRWPAGPDDIVDEGLFYADVVEATGCGLLLDLGNLLANARNANVDPHVALTSFPLEAVAMIHIAGGREIDGYWFDTHADPVGEAVFDLLSEVFARIGPRPTLLERDDAFPSTSELLEELARSRAIAAERPGMTPCAMGGPRHMESDGVGSFNVLACAQTRLAALITGDGPASASGVASDEVVRTRAVLQRKRIEAALPLLPRTTHGGRAVVVIAERTLKGRPRAPTLSWIADAWAIAAAACDEPALADGARIDKLELSARFVGPDRTGGFRRRWTPFVGHAVLTGGSKVWIFKGPGASARVHFRETRGQQ